MVKQYEVEINKCLEMITGLQSELEGNMPYGKRAMISRRLSQWKSRLNFYTNKIKTFGSGSIITVKFLGWPSNSNISSKFELTYVNIDEEDAKKLVKINSRLLYGLKRIEILETIKTSTGLNRV